MTTETATAKYLAAVNNLDVAYVGKNLQRAGLTAALGQEPTEEQLQDFGRALFRGYGQAFATQESAARYALTAIGV